MIALCSASYDPIRLRQSGLFGLMALGGIGRVAGDSVAIDL
jgi:hypothetical protein